MSSPPDGIAGILTVPPDVRTTRGLSGRLLNLVFPGRCAGCGALGDLFCDRCRALVRPVPQPVCLRCGKPEPQGGRCRACREGSFTVAAIRSAAVYAEPLNKVIHEFKYEGKPELGQPLGGLLAGYWQGRNVAADLVAAVPLHRKRQQERGYNQAQLLAETLCRDARLPLLRPDILRRERETAQQVHLGPEERRQNVSGAFVWDGPALAGARVLLIDDVATTGATLEACGEALLSAGAGRVWALTVARALGEQTG